MGVFNFRHGSLVGKDATGTPIEITLSQTAEGLTLSGLMEGQKEALPVMFRGDFQELVYGDDQPITGSLELIQVDELTDATTKLPLDWIRKTGSFASGVSQDPGLVVWTTDLVLTLTRGAVTSTITLNNCRVSAGFKEAKTGNVFSISFVAYGTSSSDQATIA